MTNILIVDDDKNFLLSLADGLLSLEDGFDIFTAENGRAAVDILGKNPIDLTITDLKMPEMDGFELLAHISRKYPEMPVIVITAFGDPEIEEKLKNIGSFQYLEKPLDFNVMVKSIHNGLEARSSGYIKGISLPSFLQLLETEKKTCTLKIKSQEKEGWLYFNKGTLTDAETNGSEGVEAALQIISWEMAEIEIDWKCKKRDQKFETSLDFIIMEAFRQKDEALHYQTSSAEEEDQDINKTSTYKETTMNVSKLSEAVNTLRKDLGEGLLATDIYSSADGQSLSGWNSNPQACALFNRITTQMNEALKGAGFPQLRRFYLLDLTDDKMVIVIPMGDYQWGMLCDSKKAQMGLVLNVALPHIIDAFEEAIAD